MDPYLERHDVFPDLHDRFATYLSEFLQARLPAPYYAALGQRVWVEVSQRYIQPEAQILRPRSASPLNEPGGGLAVVARPTTRMVVVHVPHDERREPLVEIYSGPGRERRLVTTIEVLSISNKTPGEHGRDLYLRKQREVLHSRTHLVEIDLLRGGEHTTAVPRDRLAAEASPFDYHVCVHRFDDLEDYFVYPIRLDEALPVVAIPLLLGDPAVEADMQAVFNRCYESGPYRREVSYGEDPLDPPLTHAQASWAATLLSSRGP